MIKSLHSHFVALALWLAFLPITSASAATTLLVEKFNHPRTQDSNLPLNSTTLGWKAYTGLTATDISSVNSGNTQVLIGNGNGAPVSDGYGYLYTRDDNRLNVTNRMFSVVSPTLATAWNPTLGAITLDYKTNTSHEGATTRILAEIGGIWYASNTVITPNVGDTANFTSGSSALNRSFTFDLSAGQWLSFDLTPGSSMALGALNASALSGEITRFGFYVSNPSNAAGLVVTRFDALYVTQVPEPYRGVLALLGAGWILMRRRRPMSTSLEPNPKDRGLS